MATVKFDKQDELHRLLAEITLETGIRLTKKELLELMFEFGQRDYSQLLEYIKNKKRRLSDSIKLRKQFISEFSGCIEIDEEIEEIDPKSIWNHNPGK